MLLQHKAYVHYFTDKYLLYTFNKKEIHISVYSQNQEQQKRKQFSIAFKLHLKGKLAKYLVQTFSKKAIYAALACGVQLKHT